MSVTSRMQRRKRALRRILGDRCWICGEMMSFDSHNMPNTASVDHLLPRSLGGSDDLGNLALACRTCNSKRAVVMRQQERSGTKVAVSEAGLRLRNGPPEATVKMAHFFNRAFQWN